MVPESAIRRLCSAAVFERARKIVALGTKIHVRRCRYDDIDTVLRARVDASYSWDEAYRTSVVLDEEAGLVVDYSCDCPASRRFSGPCKHAVALALDFNASPESYDGYEANTHLSSSREITRLIERAKSQVPEVRGKSTEPGPGCVHVGVTLVRDNGFHLRLRLSGMQGSYVVKSISEFVANVEGSAYHVYGKRLAFTHDIEAFDPQARPLISMLVKAIQNRRAYHAERVVGQGAYRSYGNTSASSRTLRLSSPELWELLGLYVGRSLRFEDGGASFLPGGEASLLVVDEDPVMHLDIVGENDGSYVLGGMEGMRMAVSGGRAVAWDAERLYCCSEKLSQQSDMLHSFMTDGTGGLVLAERDAPAFCAVVLPRVEQVVSVQVPETLANLRPEPCKLEFRLDKTDAGVTCAASASYGVRRYPIAIKPSAAYGNADDLVRDVQAEAKAREVLRRYFSMAGGEGAALLASTDAEVARLVYEGVPEMQRLGDVLVTSAFERLRSTTTPRVRVGLSVRSNLLDLTLLTDGVDQKELAGILRSYGLKRRYHRLRDGSFVDLDTAEVTDAARLVEELGLKPRQFENGQVTLPAYRALVVDSLAPDAVRDASFERYLERIRSVDLQSYEVPSGLKGSLRPYQEAGFRWLCGLAELGLGGILADEMGLGKSIQLISFLLSRAEDVADLGPSLVVCPASLVYNWMAEFARFAPALEVRAAVGSSDERDAIRRERGVDVLVTSYDLLRRDEEAYCGMRLWCLALDEAQYIKNHETRAAHVAKALDARVRFALTGTPVENRLSELWSIFDFLMPGLLGTYDRFRERYERPIVEDEDGEVSRRLRDGIRPFVLRRLKRDVVSDLPDKIEEVVHAKMGVQQRRVYDAQVAELREQLAHQADDAFGKGKIQILAALTRLRQTCCDPQLVLEGYDGDSTKIETIMTLLGRSMDAGSKTLLFSQFTSFLDLISQELDRRGIRHYVITGSTPKRRRVELVDQFNSDDVPVFLISLKAGGTGLNLTGASVVIHADPWWNVAAQNQATDRAHRIGQTQRVTVYQVVASDSIEERILDMQESKAKLADEVVDGETSGYSLSRLTREDLENLLG